MHAVVEKKQFTEYIQSLDKISGKHLNLEVLGCIRMEGKKEGVVRIQATNLDIGMEIDIPGEVTKEGIVAIPSTTASSFLGNAGGEKVTIKTKNNTATLTTKTATASINTIPHEDFPVLPKAKGKEIRVSTNVFSTGLRSVWYAASTSNMKPELSSVLVAVDGSDMKFVATDSFRLAEKKIHTKQTLTPLTVLVPIKNTSELIRNMEKEDVDTRLVASEDQLSVLFGDTHITSRLIDGTFPDYEQIMPKEHTTEIVTLKQDLIQGLKTVNPLVNKFNQVTLSADKKEKSFTISATGGEVGEVTANISASFSGEAVEANFNQKYISDSMQSITDDSVILRFFGPGKPMIIRGASDPSFVYLTMPMNR